MAKTLKTIGMIAGAIALVATGVGVVGGATFASTATGAAVAKVATYASIAAGVANVGSSLAYSHKPPPARGSITRVLIDPDAPQPYMMGEGYFAGVLRHDAAWGAPIKKVPNPYRMWVVDYSGGGPVQSITPYVDQGAVPSWYSGYLFTDTQLGATPEADALSPQWAGAPGWSSASKISGHAAIAWSFLFDKDRVRYASGLPQTGAYGQWVKVYDPRLDSTQAGGSGAHRSGDETTWAYSANPALHAGTYALGRHQNGKRTFGAGLPASAIDWASVIAWANVCDANAWTIFGAIFEPMPETRWPNLRDIAAAGGGVPIFVGGKLSFSYSAPRVALDTVTEADLIEGADHNVTAMASFKGRINTIFPKYRSPDHNWELVTAGAPIIGDTYVTEDGERRDVEWPFNLVKDGDQAAQLAAYRIAEGRELQPIVLVCNLRLAGYEPGDCLHLDIPTLALDHDAVIVAREFDPVTLQTRFTLISETPGKHDWALGRTITAPPTAGLSQTAQERDEIAAGAAGPPGWLMSQIRTASVLNPRDAGDVARALLIATDAGASATISVAKHDWDYPDGGDVVTRELGTITGLSFSTLYHVYFDDPTLADESVTYYATTDRDTALNSAANPGRHYLGSITTPADGGAPTVNPGTGGAGGQPGLSTGVTVQQVIAGALILSPRDGGDAARALLIASDAGASATVSVAKHDWDYPAGTGDVTRALGSITGLSFDTIYYVYFDDATLTNTAPTYYATTTFSEALNSSAHPVRHYLGTIKTPVDGAGDTYAPGTGGAGGQVGLVVGNVYDNDFNILVPDAPTGLASLTVTTLDSGNVNASGSFTFTRNPDPAHKNNIDAFRIYVWSADTNAAHTLGTSTLEEITDWYPLWLLGATQSYPFLRDRAPNKYYTVGVSALRHVNASVKPERFVQSAILQLGPTRPASTHTVGTGLVIGGQTASNVGEGAARANIGLVTGTGAVAVDIPTTIKIGGASGLVASTVSDYATRAGDAIEAGGGLIKANKVLEAAIADGAINLSGFASNSANITQTSDSEITAQAEMSASPIALTAGDVVEVMIIITYEVFAIDPTQDTTYGGQVRPYLVRSSDSSVTYGAFRDAKEVWNRANLTGTGYFGAKALIMQEHITVPATASYYCGWYWDSDANSRARFQSRRYAKMHIAKAMQ